MSGSRYQLPRSHMKPSLADHVNMVDLFMLQVAKLTCPCHNSCGWMELFRRPETRRTMSPHSLTKHCSDPRPESRPLWYTLRKTTTMAE